MRDLAVRMVMAIANQLGVKLRELGNALRDGQGDNIRAFIQSVLNNLSCKNCSTFGRALANIISDELEKRKVPEQKFIAYIKENAMLVIQYAIVIDVLSG